jgi:hypothetical protein
MKPTIKTLPELVQFLRNLPDEGTEFDGEIIGFDMFETASSRQDTAHPCGSACCIGGWAMLLTDQMQADSMVDVLQGMDPLLSSHELFRLCFPRHVTGAYEATAKQGARALEILIETGTCDWGRALQEA